MKYFMRIAWFPVMCVLAGCAAPGSSPPLQFPDIEPYLGVYRGSFDSALTDDPGDDLNHNPCPSDAGTDCASGERPLKDVLLALERHEDGSVSLQFFRDASGLAAHAPMDLLGRGCGTRLGSLASVTKTSTEVSAVVPLTAAVRLCLGKLRPVSKPSLRLVMEGADRGAPAVRVVIDKSVRDTNYLYVVDNGVRRRVRVDLDNSVTENHQIRYRICIENDLGEYDQCVLTDREFKSFTLPIPLPGGVGISYTWWQELRPKLRGTRGRYEVEQYVGRFERLDTDR